MKVNARKELEEKLTELEVDHVWELYAAGEEAKLLDVRAEPTITYALFAGTEDKSEERARVDIELPQAHCTAGMRAIARAKSATKK